MKKLTLVAALLAAAAGTWAQNAKVETETKSETKEFTTANGTVVTVENTNISTVKIVEPPPRPVKQARRTAIFIRNDTGEDILDDKAKNFILNQVRSQASKGDFEIIDWRDAIASIKPMPDALQSADGVNQMRRYLALQADLNRLQGNTNQKNLGGQGTTSDERLLAGTSFVRLAQGLDADYVMLLTLDGFEAEDFQNENDPKKWWHKYTLDASYTLMDYNGFSIAGDSFDVTLRYTKNARLTDKSYPNDLSRDMAKRLAADMKKNAKEWREKVKTLVPVSFDAQAMTMDNQPLYIQFDMLLNQVVRNDAQVPVRVAALVDVDGVTVGTTDCVVPLVKGMHKVRVHRQGMDDVHMTINAQDGLKVNVPMRVTEGEMLRVQALQKNIHDMTLAKETNQAIAEKIRGEAEMLRNSHVRIDADNLPDVHVHKEIFYPPSQNMLNVINNNNVNTTVVTQ